MPDKVNNPTSNSEAWDKEADGEVFDPRHNAPTEPQPPGGASSASSSGTPTVRESAGDNRAETGGEAGAAPGNVSGDSGALPFGFAQAVASGLSRFPNKTSLKRAVYYGTLTGVFVLDYIEDGIVDLDSDATSLEDIGTYVKNTFGDVLDVFGA